MTGCMQREAELVEGAHNDQQILVPDGWMLVPIVPTDEMISRGCDEEVGLKQDYYLSKVEASWDDCERVYAAMISKAPKYEGTYEN